MAIHYVDNLISASTITDYNHLTYTEDGSDFCFKTIADVNAHTFVAGDQILFRKGQIWRENLEPTGSGSEGSPITFGVFGSGALPIIRGTTLLTSFTEVPEGSYDWAFDNEEALPGDWTSETDTGSNLSRTTGAAAHEGTYGITAAMTTTVAYLSKTGLTSTASWYYKVYFKLSSDFSIADGTNFHIFDALYTSAEIVYLYIARSGSNYYIKFTYNAPSWTSMGNGPTAISLDTWHELKIWGTGLQSVSGAWHVTLDGTAQFDATGLDFTSINGRIDILHMGIRNAPNTPAGTFYFDDGYFDQDDSGPTGDTNQWYATLDGGTTATTVFNDTTFLNSKVASLSAVTSAGTWFQDTGNDLLYIYATEEPTSVDVVLNNMGAITLNNKDWVVVEYIQADMADDCCIAFYNSQNMTVRYCNIYNATWHPLHLNGGSSATIHDCSIKNSGLRGCDATLGFWDAAGIEVTDAASSLIMYDCEFYYDIAYMRGNQDGIMCMGGNMEVYNNYCHDWHGSGIVAYGSGDAVIDIYNNICTGSYYHGIQFNTDGSTYDYSGVRVYYNLCYDNGYHGFSAQGRCQGWKLYNNVFYDNGIDGIFIGQYATGGTIQNNLSAGNNYGIELESGGSTTANHNAYYDNATNNYNGISGGTGDVTTDPLLVDPTGTPPDFRIGAGSPCINAGVDVGLTEDYVGNPIIGLPDIGAYEYLKSYSRGNYADLPADDADLETVYSSSDVAAVATNDGSRISQSASGQYAIHQFKNVVTSTSVTVSWDGQSNIAPSDSSVVLQIYDRVTSGGIWETLDTESLADADVDFELSGSKADLTNYKDDNDVVCHRVYQLAQ